MGKITPHSLKTTSTYNNFPIENGWYLLHYDTTKKYKKGTLSNSIVAFKNNEDTAIGIWKEIISNALNEINVRFDFIVRALSSRETIAAGTSGMDAVANAIAHRHHCIYDPNILRKIERTPPLHLATLRRRQKILYGKYYVQPPDECPGFTLDLKNVLILDDLTTTGTTIHEISKRLKQAYPKSKLYFLCLGKTKSKWPDRHRTAEELGKQIG